jgi:tetratricopeptide (TPR) repeat protein
VEARLTKTPNDPAILLLAARVYAMTGDLAKAEAPLLKTLEVAPDTLEAYGMLGQVYAMQKKLNEARQMFAGMAARQSKPVGAETMVGMIFEMQGKRAEAQKQYEKVLTIDPHAAIAANNLAWMHVEAGDDLDIALQLAQTAKAQLPNQPEVNDTLGWIFYKKGLTTLSLGPLFQAVDKAPKNAVFQFHLGMALAKNGEKDKALAALQTALALDPNFAGAADAVQTLTTLR